MYFQYLLSGSALFALVHSYAHYSQPDFKRELKSTLNRRARGSTPGSDGSPDGLLIGDLRFSITTQSGIDVSDILLSNQDGESDVTGTKPSTLESCLTSKDVCCPWWFISDYLTTQFVGDDGLCNDLARAAVRLGFHDAGTWSQPLADSGKDFGGADGSLVLFGEVSRSENGGLEEINELATFLWGEYGDYNIGMADLVQFMSVHATVTCPLGPRIRTWVGRKDAVRQAPDGLLPSVHADANSLVQLFIDKTISPHELTALLGAHSTSKQFGVDKSRSGAPQDTTPGVWDVNYYAETIQSNASSEIFVFPSDEKLAVHPEIQDEWLSFIDDQHHWNEDYARAYVRLSMLGVNNINSLMECTKTLPPKQNSIPKLSEKNITSSSSVISSSTSTYSSSLDILSSSTSTYSPLSETISSSTSTYLPSSERISSSTSSPSSEPILSSTSTYSPSSETSPSSDANNHSETIFSNLFSSETTSFSSSESLPTINRSISSDKISALSASLSATITSSNVAWPTVTESSWSSTSSIYHNGSSSTSSSTYAEDEDHVAWSKTRSHTHKPTATAGSVKMASVITTKYIDICPAGFTTIETIYTIRDPPSNTIPAVPYGWTTTVTFCTNCAAKPTTVTLTKPIADAYLPLTTETSFSTRLHIIADKGHTSVSSEIIPVHTTTHPVAVAAATAKPYKSSVPDVPSILAQPAAVSAYIAAPYLASSIRVDFKSMAPSSQLADPKIASTSRAIRGSAPTSTTGQAYTTALSKFTGAAVKESLNISILSGAILFVLLL